MKALGTERVRTDTSGAVCQTLTSLPFGDGESASGSCSPTPTFFTGLERDAESGLDHTLNRQYSSNYGRWVSPDLDNAGEEDTDPQTWDAYGYVMDNPTTGTDPSGLDCLYTSGDSATSITVTTERGQCTSPGGTYVNGTVDVNSFTYNGSELGYSFTPYSGGSGTGVIAFSGADTSDQQALETLSLAGAEANAGLNSSLKIMAINGLLAGAGVGLEAIADLAPVGPETGISAARAGVNPDVEAIASGLKPSADDTELQGAINQLYQESDTLPGGTAGAVRRELATGERVGGRLHSIKAAQRISQIRRILDSGRLSPHDSEVARALIQDLSAALAGK